MCTLHFTGAIFGSIMLTSAMVIKSPHPSYKVPGLDTGPVADAGSKPAPPAVQVNRLLSISSCPLFVISTPTCVYVCAISRYPVCFYAY